MTEAKRAAWQLCQERTQGRRYTLAQLARELGARGALLYMVLDGTGTSKPLADKLRALGIPVCEECNRGGCPHEV